MLDNFPRQFLRDGATDNRDRDRPPRPLPLWCVLTSTDGSFALVSSNASRYGIIVGVVNCCSVVPADRLFCCGTNLAM